MNQSTPEADYVVKLINQTNQNIFLTGKAGTGKTTLLREIVKSTHKNAVIIAPTGIAAINAGGVTIHSMFQLPFNPFVPVEYFDYPQIHFDTKKSIYRHFKVRADKRNLINNIELLIVDEVSMLRPDILDAMDTMLQYIRYSRKPFGGVQVLFIGDLQQLPPIIKPAEWDLLSQFYQGKYFFHAHVLQAEQPLYIELTKIFRQSDQEFIHILNELRHNQITPQILETLDQYVEPDFDIRENPGYIVLTTHNQLADTMNAEALDIIRKRESTYKAKIVDDFPEHLYPLDKEIVLKEGAQVMFIKNDLNFEKRYYNGKIGTIKSLEEDEIIVRFPEENIEISVDEHEWENKKYKLNPLTNEIEEELLGTYTQYPLKLAWAITIHKSQGLTFEKAAIDIANIFAPGQAYVALSRLTSLKGLKLLSPIGSRKIATEADILEYENNKTPIDDLERELPSYTKDFLYQQLVNTYDFSYPIRMADRLQKELFESSENAAIYRHKKWIEQNIEEIFELNDVAKKFQNSLTQMFGKIDLPMDYIYERTEKAYDYFYEKLLFIEKNILYKISEVAFEKGTKELENILHEVENSLFTILKQMMKSKRIIYNVTQNKPLDKSSCDTKDIEKIKLNIISEIRQNREFDPKYLLEPTGRGLNKKKKKETEKIEKKPTHEISFELWEQKKTIEEICQIRKLTSGTIFGHLVKYVSLGKIEITDLVPLDILKSIEKKLPSSIDLKSLAEVRAILGNDYSFDELSLYRAWKEMTNS